MSRIDDIVRKYDTYEGEEWDEETKSNWDDKTSDPAMHNSHDDIKPSE